MCMSETILYNRARTNMLHNLQVMHLLHLSLKCSLQLIRYVTNETNVVSSEHVRSALDVDKTFKRSQFIHL